jgi:RimJ/RimL family protein N-acetyltransferase
MFIRSKRLFLRPGWPEDWTELFPAINEEKVVRDLATAPWPYAMEDAMAFARRPQERLLPHFLVTLPTGEGAKLVGSAGLTRYEGRVELSFWIAGHHRGNGYATEAVGAVVRLAEALGHQRIGAVHFADNPASGRVLIKAGFRKCGELSERVSMARGGGSSAFDYEIKLGAACDGETGALMHAA